MQWYIWLQFVKAILLAIFHMQTKSWVNIAVFALWNKQFVKQIVLLMIFVMGAWIPPAHWWGCPAASDRPGRTCDHSRVCGGVSLPDYTHCSRWCSPVSGCPWSSVLQPPRPLPQEPQTRTRPHPRPYRMSSIWYKHLCVFAWDVQCWLSNGWLFVANITGLKVPVQSQQ